MNTGRNFCSKILLFGEYGIIKNSMGLCVPFPLFEGKLIFPSEGSVSAGAKESNQELKSLCQYLREMNGSVGAPFDLDSFEFDLEQGLFFDSTIPHGYGLGSSGALTAAVFDRYASLEKSGDNILRLKEILSKVEAHFHGKSSGLDPLVSFLRTPILIESQGKLAVAQIPEFDKGDSAIFLLNTGRPRRTEPLVNLFLEKCKQEDFNQLCLTRLKEINDGCVSSFLAQDKEALFQYLAQLSQFQLEHMAPMIPTLYQKLWKEGVESKEFSLKLCGAGGGGFLLGIARDFRRLKKRLTGPQLRVVYSF